MNATHFTRSLKLVSLLVGGLLASCSRAPQVSYGSTSIIISNSDNEWAKDIRYVSGSDGTSLTVDGVRFEVLDMASVVIDFEGLGLKGVTVTTTHTASYKSTEPKEDAFMTSLGRSVAIREGKLFWGAESLGKVQDGDVFLADGQGLRAKPK